MQVWTGVISTEIAGERVMDAPNGAMMYAHTHTHANDNEQQRFEDPMMLTLKQ